MSNNQQPFGGLNMAQLNQLNPALFAQLTGQMQQQQQQQNQPQASNAASNLLGGMQMPNQAGNNQVGAQNMGGLRGIPPQLLQQMQQQQTPQSGPNQQQRPPAQQNDKVSAMQNMMMPMYNRLQTQNRDRLEQARLQAVSNPALQAQIAAEQLKAHQNAQAAQSAQAQTYAQAQAQQQASQQVQQQSLGVQGVAGMQGMGGLPGMGGMVGFSQNQDQQGLGQNGQRPQSQLPNLSQQQGLGVAGQGQGMMDDNVRRAALQNMLQNNSTPAQPTAPATNNAIPPEVRELLQSHPDLVQTIFRKHANNSAGAMEEIRRVMVALRAQGAGVPVGINGQVAPPRTVSQTVPGNATKQGHQRVGSETFNMNQFGNMNQLDLLQQLKQTPQVNQQVLSSPQIHNANTATNQQTYPQPPQARPAPPRIQPTPPQNNRQPQSAQAQMAGVMGALANMGQWTSERILQVVIGLSKKIGQARDEGAGAAGGAPGGRPWSPAESIAKFQLLLVLAELKKRGMMIPEDVLAVGGILMPMANHREALLNAEPAKLQEVAKLTFANVERIRQATMAQQQQQQNVGQAPQVQGQDQMSAQQLAARRFQGQQQSQQQPMRGSQNNPIELVTPTMNNSQLPGQFPTPVQASAGSAPMAQQPSGQSMPNATPLLGNAQPPMQGQQSGQTGMEAIQDIPEEAFYNSMRAMMHKGTMPVLQNGAPSIEGKQVNLHKLFQIVIRNNGFANIDAMRWTFIAGQLGFAHPGTNTSTETGQPPISSPHIAGQIRSIYASVLQPMETAFMAARRARMGARAGQPQAQKGGTGATPLLGSAAPIGQGQQQQIQGSGGLSEQQKRFLDAAKASGGGPSVVEAWQQQQALHAAQQAQQQQQQQQQAPQQANASRQQQSQAAGPTSQDLQNYTKMAFKMLELVKMSDGLIRGNLDKMPNQPGVDAQGYVNDLRTIIPSAKEAETRLPILLMLMTDAGTGFDHQLVMQCLHACIAPQYAFLAAERQNRYVLAPADIMRIKTSLGAFNGRLQTVTKLINERPGGSLRIKAMVESVHNVRTAMLAKTQQQQAQAQSQMQTQGQGQDGLGLGLNLGNMRDMVQQITQSLPQQAPAAQSSLAPPSASQNIAIKDSPSAIQDAIRQKGLRVEDLKPPPAPKRGGKKPGIAAGPGSSPAAAVSGATPEGTALKTPGATGDSPKDKKVNKRKRQSTGDKGGKGKKKATDANVPELPSPLVSTAIPPQSSAPAAQVNSLELQLTAEESARKAEIEAHRGFFDQQQEMMSVAGLGDGSKSVDSALEMFGAIYGAHQQGLSQAASHLETGLPTSKSNPSAAPLSASAPAPSAPLQAGGMDPNDSDLFDTYFDASQFSIASNIPTPDLVIETPHPYGAAAVAEGHGAREEGVDSSPESVRTVGSTGVVVVGENKGNTAGMEVDLGEGAQGKRVILGSPGSMAYNGGIEW
ncbi:hypothetical protein L202_06144 [Cryptococcus amylolentus CBS 6039]|uniref:ARID domain-containing protein n=2 Tax=Cryptococcus amylolentus TaxID=104669 RepID=A0A1E3HIQ8_9TREE|nr:hypothetical protein L202_06144 [Cryptococcus amylolentus CBS 6039]ODN76224.1 hypothetical protein L202_06144 [Cryptococcus amylolentus CBS 6039]ODN96297.1 hypothetical protein I350_08317 [Cryptococcus amylolentus CBS 6273]